MFCVKQVFEEDYLKNYYRGENVVFSNVISKAHNRITQPNCLNLIKAMQKLIFDSYGTQYFIIAITWPYQ